MEKMKFEFVLPTRIKFGAGIIKELCQEIDASGTDNILVITDKGLVKAGIAGQVISIINKQRIGELVVYDEVEPNPRDTTVHKAADLAKNHNINLIIAIGGGSSIDVAKAVSILLTNEGTIQDFEGLDKIPNRPAPLIAIPTTVGTGSEVTFWSVITDSKRHFKMSIGSSLIAPKLALVDPELVENLPPAIIASTGMDALTHAIEGYTCLLSEPITDACGLYAIELLSQNIRNAVLTENVQAKSNMLLGSLLAGICFGNSDIAGVHAMAEALGGLYDTPHGIANAILLPYVMEYNFAANTEKFARVSEALGEVVSFYSERDAAYEAVQSVKKLTEDLNIPSLASIGARIEDFEELAQKSSVNVSTPSNPKKIDQAAYLQIFKNAFYNTLN